MRVQRWGRVATRDPSLALDVPPRHSRSVTTPTISLEALDPRTDPEDPLAGIEPYPAPLDAAKIPAHLRDNPLVETYLALTAEQEAGLARLADSDAEDDEAVAAALLASAR